MFLVPKKDGGVRVVQDFRALNANSYDDRYSMKNINECIGDCDHSRQSRQRSRRRFEPISFNSVHFIFDKKSLYVFRTRVLFFPSLYMFLYIFLRKYTSCNLGPNIECFNSLFLCSFVFLCKYNWIYSYSLWDLKSIISVLGF